MLDVSTIPIPEPRVEKRPGEKKTRVAVLIPCHNEAVTIGKVIDDFRRELPDADIYVFDNCCTDDTVTIAERHGAMIKREPRRGKGYVIENMLSVVEADYFVMVDGDDTYEAGKVTDLLEPVMKGEADLVVGRRHTECADQSYRPLHVTGNNLVRWLINTIFRANLKDIMSGYRAFNRRVCNWIPVVSSGFEVETEMTIQILYYRLKIVEVQVPYRGRPEGSESKLRTFHDGFRVLWKIFSLFRAIKPLTFLGGVGLLLFVLGLAAGIPPILDYMREGYVYRVPLAILATGLMLMSAGCTFVGVILHAVNWRIKELHNVIVRGRS